MADQNQLTELKPDAVIADRFRLDRLTWGGGSSDVWRAVDGHAERPVAIKILNAGGGDHARFDREAALLSSMHHPGIVPYVAHGGLPGGRRYLVTEWIDGESLEEILIRGPIEWRRTVDILTEISSALSFVHRMGATHRDLKPANVLIRPEGKHRVQLVDFGVAHWSSPHRLTYSGELIGTPGYMAPEQARGLMPLDARADVFALGCVAYECLAGQPAFSGDNLMAVLAKTLFEQPSPLRLHCELPSLLNALVSRMLSKQPLERPADAARVLSALHAISADQPGNRRASENLRITTDEQKVVTVLTARQSAATAPIHAELATASVESLYALAGEMDVQLERMVDGTFIAVLSSSEPTDQATRAAQLALDLLALVPSLSIALVTDRADTRGTEATGEALDRAGQLLSRGERRVLVDAVTRSLIDSRFRIASLASETAPGQMIAFRLEGERLLNESARTIFGRRSPFIGRRSELGTLLGTFASSVEDQSARRILVIGEPGIGKSRLRSEFLSGIDSKIAPKEPWVLLGQADPWREDAPFGLIASAMRGWFPIHRRSPLAERQSTVESRIAEIAPAAERQRLTAFLGELVQTPMPLDTHPSLAAARENPQSMGDQMRRAVEDWIAYLVADRPVILVLEDIQWADRLSIESVEQLNRRMSERAFFTLALARPGALERFPALFRDQPGTTLRMPILSKKASEQLVHALLVDDPGAPTVGTLVESAGGNPFLLEELIRAHVAGTQSSVDGPHGADGAAMAITQARLSRLPPQTRQVLRAASIFGETFEPSGIEALVGDQMGVTTIELALEELRKLELIEPDNQSMSRGTGYRFQHALSRDAAYRMLTEADRKSAHQLAAEWLEYLGGEEAALVAHHFTMGGEASRARRHYRVAASRALNANDFGAVLHFTERALETATDERDIGELYALRAEALYWSGRTADAEAEGLMALARLPERSPLWCDVLARLAHASVDLARAPRVQVNVDAASDALNMSEPPSFVQLCAARVATSSYHQASKQSLQTLLTRLESVRSPDQEPPHLKARMLSANAAFALRDGDAARFLELFIQVAELQTFVDDPRSLCLAQLNVGLGYIQLGQYESAETSYREGHRTAERMGLVGVVANAEHNLGLCLARMGRLDEALSLERQALSTYERSGSRTFTAGCQLYLSIIYAAKGDWEQAREAATLAASETAPIGIRAAAFGRLSDALISLDDPTAALEASERGMEILEARGALDEGEMALRLSHANALRALGDPRFKAAVADARSHLDEVAGRIKNPKWRSHFMSNISENARIIALSDEAADAK